MKWRIVHQLDNFETFVVLELFWACYECKSWLQHYSLGTVTKKDPIRNGMHCNRSLLIAVIKTRKLNLQSM